MRRKRLVTAGLTAVALLGLSLGGCCAIRPHHQRRLGPDPDQFSFAPDGDLAAALGRPVLRFGAEDATGPAVLLLHEIGGATPETLELAGRLKGEGYTVYVPVFFGEPGQRRPRIIARCLSHDFNCLVGSASPLARRLSEKLLPVLAAQHSSIGVIGMCLTGSFPLLLAQHEAVKAAVLSQPALPLFRKRAVGLSHRELAVTRAALRDKDVKIRYFRYSQDCLSPAQRLAALETALPGRIDARVFPACDPEHHAVLTDSLTETPEAWDCLTSYLAEALQGRPSRPGACPSQEELMALGSRRRCGEGC